MVIDVHAHLSHRTLEQDKQTLLRAAEAYRIDRIYIAGLNGYTPTPEEAEQINQEVYAFVREHPERFGAYTYVSPEHPGAAETVRRGVEDFGAIGVKLWVSRLCDDPCVNPVVERAIEYGIPVLIHCWHKVHHQFPQESVGSHVANLARRYPEAKLIMAHLGGNCYHGLPAIRDFANVRCDFSGSIFRGGELEYAVHTLGADRVLFGSDLPNFYLDCYGQVLEADLPQEDKEKILWRNASSLFKSPAANAGRQAVIA